jgi:AAA ATPase domain
MKSALPSAWNLYGLASNPFFHDALSTASSDYPLELFVGRKAEVAELTEAIVGAGGGSSRQAVAGEPGVGKTTLVKKVKAWAHDSGYFAVDELVPILSTDTPTTLFGRALGMVYHTILAERPTTYHASVMQAAQAVVHTERERVYGGGVSVLGIGGSVSQSVMQSVPSDLMLDGPRLLRNMLQLVESSDGRGILLHLNNLENLRQQDAARAGTLLRDLRDPLFMHPGLHVIVVGTPDAITAAVGTHAQVRSVVQIRTLEPIPLVEVHALLAARYAHLRLPNADGVPVAPVAPAAVAALYALYRGDLRGLLLALADAVPRNLDRHGGAASLTLADLSHSLHLHALARLDALTPERAQQLLAWGAAGPGDRHTQESLGALWRVKQPTVSQILIGLQREGFVNALPRRPGRGRAGEYVLSGTSRLLF